MANHLQLAIEGMHCEACVRRVTNALAAIKGVKVDSVKVGSANVEFDPVAVNPNEITAAVDRTGFRARVDR